MNKKEFQEICKKRFDKSFQAMGDEFGLTERTVNNWYYNGPMNKLFDKTWELYNENIMLKSELVKISERIIDLN